MEDFCMGRIDGRWNQIERKGVTLNPPGHSFHFILPLSFQLIFITIWDQEEPEWRMSEVKLKWNWRSSWVELSLGLMELAGTMKWTVTPEWVQPDIAPSGQTHFGDEVHGLWYGTYNTVYPVQSNDLYITSTTLLSMLLWMKISIMKKLKLD